MKASGIRWRIIVLISFLIGVCGMVQAVWEARHPAFEYRVTETDIISIDREEAGGSGYIVEKQVFFDMDSEYPAQMTTQEIRLEKGRYQVTLQYNTNQENCIAYAYSHAGRYGEIQADSVMLNPNREQDTFDIRLKHGVSDFQIRVSTDRGGIDVDSIVIKRVRNTSMLLCGTVFAILLFLMLAILYENIRIKSFSVQQLLVLTGLAGIIILASLPLGIKGIVESQGFEDLSFHLWRIEGIAQGLKAGKLPVRIYSEYLNGYGYANGIYYGNTLLYIPAFLRLAGYSVTHSYKIYVMLIHILTALTAYLSCRGITKSKMIGLAGSALFTLAPYRLVNVYDRASVGEYTALAFIPLIFYGLWLIYKNEEKAEYRKAVFLLIVGCSGVIQSHILSVILAGLGGLAFIVWFWKGFCKKRKVFAMLQALLWIILLNAWFLTPLADCLLTQETRIMADKTHVIQKYGQDIAYLTALITGNEYQIPRSIGILLAAMPLLWIGFCTIAHYNDWEYSYKKEMTGMVLMGSGCLLLATNSFPYDFLCKNSSLINYLIGKIQFPWRWLGLAGLFLVILYVLIAVNVSSVNRKYYNIFLISTVLLVLVQAIGIQTLIMNKSVIQDYYSTDGLRQSFLYQVYQGEYMAANADMNDMETNRRVIDESNVVWEYQRSGNSFEVLVENKRTQEAEIVFPLQYYKGYHAASIETKEKLMLYENAESKVAVRIPAGVQGRIIVSYDGMWYWKAADILSLMALLAGTGLLYRRQFCNS